MAPTKSITLTVNFFDTEKNYDYLRVYGCSKGSLVPVESLRQTTPLTELSGSDTPPTKTYETDCLYVTFTSDSSTVATGISFSYSTDAVDAQQDRCYGIKKFDTDTGVIATGGSGNYQPNSRCGWSIQPLSNPEAIVLSFKTINIEQEMDFLYIYQGSSSSGVLLKTITGIPNAPDMTIPMLPNDPGVYLDFRSDANLEATGVLGSYYAVTTATDEEVKQYCAEETLIKDRTGLITDNPVQLLGYKPNSVCRWLIKPARTGSPEEVALTFTRIDLEKYYDFLYIYDGDSSDPSASSLLAKLDGNVRPGEPIIARSGVMTIQLESDDSTEGRGFEAEFVTQKLSPTPAPVDFQSLATPAPTPRVLEPFTAECPGQNYTLLTSENEEINQISDDFYERNMVSRYAIRPTQPPASITAMITYLNTEEGFDFVHIYDKPPCLGGRRIIMVTGRCGCKMDAADKRRCLDCQQRFTSFTGEMYVEFRSDSRDGAYEELYSQESSGKLKRWVDGTEFKGYGFSLSFGASYTTPGSGSSQAAYSAYSGASSSDSSSVETGEGSVVVIAIAIVAAVVSAALAAIMMYSMYKQKHSTQARTYIEPEATSDTPAVIAIGKPANIELDASATASTAKLSSQDLDLEVTEVRGYNSD
jgi:hypothetical protein